ncbi:C40 family peptidase [Paenibacillus aurantius]|uniref:C40 family peptidase n=2 Tax=Paenibacillus aurantius TaxID=2918900 RepID=A0AA96RIE7_9BACL|nr:C40 family peptidase [Paenibacillus aurantius]WNQ14338.1 C40 family peptidase [Paenibacillus aurantius]
MSFGIMAGTASASPLSDTVDDLLGTAYKYSGTTTRGFDCSGFTMYVFDQLGYDLPHTSKGQAAKGSWVAKSNLRAGDLVFFNTDGSGISHVGIYIGGGQFAHSANKYGVSINRLSDSYYAKRYVTARRIMGDEAYSELAN